MTRKTKLRPVSNTRKIRHIVCRGALGSSASSDMGGRGSSHSDTNSSEGSGPSVSRNFITQIIMMLSKRLDNILVPVALTIILSGLLATSCGQEQGDGLGGNGGTDEHTQHTWEWQNDEKQHWEKCTIGGEKQSIGSHLGNTYTVGEETTLSKWEQTDCGNNNCKRVLVPMHSVGLTSVGNMQLGKIEKTSTQGYASAQMQLAKDFLINQCNEIVKFQGIISDNVIGKEESLMDMFKRTNSGDDMWSSISNRYKDFINEIYVLSKCNDATFKTQVEAYRTAAMLSQRIVAHRSGVNNFLTDVRLMLPNISSETINTPEAAKRLLEQHLVEIIKSNNNEKERNAAYGLLQQIGDFGEFTGMISDISSARLDATAARSVGTRESVATAVGIGSATVPDTEIP